MLRGRRGLLLTSLGLVLFVAYLIYTDPFEVLMEAGRFDAAVFALSVLVNYVGLVSFSLSWFILLRVLGVGISAWGSIQATLVSFFVVWMVPIPVGTEIIRAYLVKDEEGSDLGKAIASVVVHKSFYNIAFGALIAFAAFTVTVVRRGSIPVRGDMVLFVIVFAAGSSVLFAAILNRRLLRALYERSPGWLRTRLLDRIYPPEMGGEGFPTVIEEIGAAVGVLRSRIGCDLLSFLMVAFHWSTGSITAYLVADSLGSPIDFWLIVVIYAVVEFIQQLNILIPGGLGIIDAGLTGAFVLVGVPLSTASAISLLTRMATYWLEVVLAAAVSVQYGYRESLRDFLR